MRKLHLRNTENEKICLTGYPALRVIDFAHPREVLADQELASVEKRAILAAWASDASAVESRPKFRWLLGTPGPVALSQVLDALRALDADIVQQSAAISAMAQGSHLRGASPWRSGR